jgi:UDP-4-amino-4-deoxy-L-arabinose formyltransferase/UDP-glucuronic acid dehydrogenase (UDP-4-keto-hexauronic acid decarboxylating)
MRIYNLVRAVTEPYPGAFTHLPQGEKLFIWWASPEEDSVSNRPVGTLEFKKDSVGVRASDGRLRLLDIEVGKERMNGRKILEFFKKQKGAVLK